MQQPAGVKEGSVMSAKKEHLGNGGFSNPTTFDTVEQASAYQLRADEIDRLLAGMTPAERQEWFQLNGDSRIEDLE